MKRGIKRRLKERLHLRIKLSLPEELRAVKPVGTGVLSLSVRNSSRGQFEWGKSFQTPHALLILIRHYAPVKHAPASRATMGSYILNIPWLLSCFKGGGVNCNT